MVEHAGIIRPVLLEDIPCLQEIYSYYVDQTVVSFEYVAPSISEFKRRVEAFSSNCPYLVYCENGKILGYAYAHPAFERAAYAWCAETTIYLSKEARGRGVGKRLYGALIRLLTIQGYVKAYAIVVANNEESCAFHEKNGFHKAAVFNKTGYKFGQWLDVVWYERELCHASGIPAKLLSFTEIPFEQVMNVCAETGSADLNPSSR